MSRDDYNPVTSSGVRSPGRSRRLTELPTVDRSPSRDYGARGSPLAMGSPYYRDMDEPTSPAGAGHHRSRSASRPPMSHAMDYPRTRYQSLDRGGLVDPHDREFIPIREPRDRSRDRSLERGLYLEDELYGRSARQSPNPIGYQTGLPSSDRAYLGDLQHQNTDLQRELGQLKRELELTNQKLGSSMHSIKTFWSPELKKERALRKEESAKYSLINDQLKLLSTENQKQAMLVRQLEEELRMRMRQPNIEMQQQMEALYAENDHLQREISILRETIKDLECRVETQKQTLIARDESIKKLLEMLQTKGMGKEEERQMFQQMQAMAQKQVDLEKEIKKFANDEKGMYGAYGPTGSPPLPDIIGQYYAPTGYGLGVGPPPPPPSTYDMFGPSSSAAGYLYEPTLGSSVAAGLYGQHPSPIRRRRYSIAGLPSASMMNDYYGLYAPQMQQSSSSNIVNLLNEAHKSISRSSQILNQHARMQQATQPVTPLSHYPGRIISSYPTLHPGDTSPPYLNDNLMQMSSSFSSQPNMYFQQYAPTSAATAAAAQQSAAAAAAAVAAQQAATGGHLGGRLLRPAYSVSNLNYLNYPSKYTSGGVSGIGGSSSYANPFSQSIFSQTDMPYSMSSLLQQRNLMPSLHASNPAISQYYQYATQAPHTHTHPLAYNLQQQFAGTQHYTHQLPPGAQHPSAHIHHSVQQQLNPLHQYHVHQQQHHMQTHPLAALRETSGPFAATLTSSALDDAGLTGRAGLSAGGGVGGVGGVATGAAGVAAASAYDSLHTAPSYQHHHHQQQQQQQQQQHLSHLSQQHLQHHHHLPTTSAPLSHTSTPYHHHQHMSPYSKLDLDYPKLPSEHKRQVSFKFDVDTLSLDS